MTFPRWGQKVLLLAIIPVPLKKKIKTECHSYIVIVSRFLNDSFIQFHVLVMTVFIGFRMEKVAVFIATNI